MLLWFIGGTIVIVWFVFRSAALDYRMLGIGAVLPVLEVFYGHDWFLHTLAAPVVAMTVIMVATTRRRLARRRWLCLPIGMFSHLVLDGVWTRNELFWWPVFGWSFGDKVSLELSRGLGVNLVLEVIGAAVLVWFWRRFDLADQKRRHRFLTTGNLDRALV